MSHLNIQAFHQHLSAVALAKEVLSAVVPAETVEINEGGPSLPVGRPVLSFNKEPALIFLCFLKCTFIGYLVIVVLGLVVSIDPPMSIEPPVLHLPSNLAPSSITKFLVKISPL